MVQKCCVFGCLSSSDAPSHRFPVSLEMQERWKNSIKYFRKSAPTTSDIKQFRVCYLHFTANDYKTEGYKRRLLKDDVIPTLNLPMLVGDNYENNRNIITPVQEGSEIIHVHENAMEGTMTVLTEPGPSGTRPVKQGSSSTARKPRRFHLLEEGSRHVNLTPKATRLYRVASRMRRQQLSVARKLFGYRRRLREARKYIKNKTFQMLMSSLSYDQRVFINMQIRNTKYQPKGRRFTTEEKILALSLYKQSGKCYRFLEAIFSLPSARSLRTMLHSIELKTGCNQFIKEHLKKQVQTMKDIDKVCCIIWDEMALQPHIDYDQTSQNIIGFEDYGNSRHARYADHALVFMIRGINKGWLFPVAHFFSDHQTNTERLVKCIKSITKVIVDCGLIPVAYVCDQGKPNIAAVNKLKHETYVNTSGKLKYESGIYLYNQYIIPLYDPPHLLKGIRNNLLKRDLEVDFKNATTEERRFASWRIINFAFEMASHSKSLYRQMPKITDRHIQEKYMKKMNVKLAAQVFSRTVGGYIDHLTYFDGNMDTTIGPMRMPKEGHDTAEAILFFDELFDSVNGHTQKPETPLRVVVYKDSQHHNFWSTAIDKLQNMRFVNVQTKQPVHNSPVIKNWIATIQGFQSVWQILKEFGFKYFKPRYFNQDPLENFFGSIRSLNFRYNNPTCSYFQSSVKTLLLNNLTSRQLIGNNCENICNGALLFTIENLTTGNDKGNIAFEEEQVENLIIQDFADVEYSKFLNPNITDKIISKIFCDKELESCSDCNKIFSDGNNHFFNETYKLLLTCLPNVCFKRNLKLILQTALLTNINFDFISCELHRDRIINSYIDSTISYTVYSWCQFINEVLNGKRLNIVNKHSIYKKAVQRRQRSLAKTKKPYQK